MIALYNKLVAEEKYIDGNVIRALMVIMGIYSSLIVAQGLSYQLLTSLDHIFYILYPIVGLTGVVVYYLSRKGNINTSSSTLMSDQHTFYDLLDRIPEGVVIVNHVGEIVYINRKAKNIFWYNAENLVGKEIRFLIPDSDEEEKVLDALEECLQTNSSIPEFEVFAKRGDNFYFPASVSLSPLKYQDQAFAVLTVADVSLHKLDEERVKLQHFSIEQATDSVFWIDRNGQVLYANETACRTLGYTALEMSLLNIWSLDSSATQKRWNNLWSMAQQYSSCVFETELTTHTYGKIPVEVTANYVGVEEQEYICAFARNITMRKFDAQQLELYAAELERKNKELEQLTYITSHNLQEPLRSISSFLQLLDKRYKGRLDHDADEFISFAVDGVKHMHYLLRDLSYYSKLSMQPNCFETVNATATLKKCLHQLWDEIKRNKAKVTYDVLPNVRGDQNELQHLLSNLVSNALKYRSDLAPEIHISVEQGNMFWTFSVKDNGIGIEPEYCQQIFKMFNRLTADKKYIKGTGMGLAICQKIVEKHGGKIWAESELGKGATFYFTLPMHVEAFENLLEEEKVKQKDKKLVEVR